MRLTSLFLISFLVFSQSGLLACESCLRQIAVHDSRLKTEVEVSLMPADIRRHIKLLKSPSKDFNELNKAYDKLLERFNESKVPEHLILGGLIDVYAEYQAWIEHDDSLSYDKELLYEKILQFILEKYDASADLDITAEINKRGNLYRKYVCVYISLSLRKPGTLPLNLDILKESISRLKKLVLKKGDDKKKEHILNKLINLIISELSKPDFESLMKKKNMIHSYENIAFDYLNWLVASYGIKTFQIIEATDNSFIVRAAAPNGKECVLKLGKNIKMNEKMEKEYQIIKKLNPDNKRSDLPRITEGLDSILELANGTRGFAAEPFGGKNFFSLAITDFMDTDKALRLLLKIAETLEYIHQAGIVHLDIKPSSITATESEEVIVHDFNVSEFQNEKRKAIINGTIPYISPERLFGRPEGEPGQDDDPASDLIRYLFLSTSFGASISIREDFGYHHDIKEDIYSFGVMMAEALSRKIGYEIDEALSRDDSMFMFRPSTKKSIEKEFDYMPELRDLILKCISIKPIDRCSDQELIDSLRNIIAKREKELQNRRLIEIPDNYKKLKNLVNTRNIHASGSDEKVKSVMAALEEAMDKEIALVWAKINGIDDLDLKETKRFVIFDASDTEKEIFKNLDRIRIGDVEIRAWDCGDKSWKASQILEEMDLEPEKTRFILSEKSKSRIIVDACDAEIYDENTMQSIISDIVKSFKNMKIEIHSEFDKLKELTRVLDFA